MGLECGKEVFLIIRGGVGMGKNKTMWNESDNVFVKVGK